MEITNAQKKITEISGIAEMIHSVRMKISIHSLRVTERGELGRAAELPPLDELDAEARPHARARRFGADPPGIPPLAHVLPVQDFPGGDPAELSQGDERSAEGPARKSPRVLLRRRMKNE